MNESSIKRSYIEPFKACALFILLLIYVLLINIPTISYGMVYFEQAPIYVANQMIHSFTDLLNVYLHPKMLYYYSIYFFRPSGHFLLYQLLAPLLGWHNIKGFIIVNLVFLTLSGYLMIRVYQLLFPGFIIGGCIAFSIYLMHPTLILSRLMTEHFDFAYIFFILLSLYYFIIFCQKNQSSIPIKSLRFAHFHLLAMALLFYAIAITFKDSALMLGCVLASYFLIFFYRHSPHQAKIDLIKNTQAQQIIILLAATSLMLFLYLTLPWPTTFNHPLLIIGADSRWLVIKYFIQLITATSFKKIYFLLINDVQFPVLSRLIIWFFCLLMLLQLYYATRDRWQHARHLRSVLFLCIAAILFLLLPVAWARAKPWHLSPSLVFVSLIMGFSFESLYRRYFKKGLYVCGITLSILVGLSSTVVTYAHINQHTAVNFSLKLNHNAIYYPPHLSSPFNADTIVVVAAIKPVSDYYLGAGFYPYFPYHPSLTMKGIQDLFYVPVDTIYAGDLFRWAYLMPNLKEMIYPFMLNDFSTVPDIYIYLWSLHYHNIVCLSYDTQANWLDVTKYFKHNLRLEQRKRHLVIHAYSKLPMTQLKGKRLYAKALAVPHAELCQKECDQNTHCLAFSYSNITNGDAIARCEFFNSPFTKLSGLSSTSFIKNKALSWN